jgi:Rod binding domain-containing protein
MFEGIKSDGPFGGGYGESVFRSLMIEHYSKTIAEQGGFGLADQVKREILRFQEVKP